MVCHILKDSLNATRKALGACRPAHRRVLWLGINSRMNQMDSFAPKQSRPTGRNARHTRVSIVLACVVWCLFAWSAFADTNQPVKRVLIVHSFGREFAPFGVMAASFRIELARQSRVPIEFHEVSFQSARFQESVNEQPVVDYLKALFAGQRLDLVVAMGGPATLFVNRHRGHLFPWVPLVATLDVRRAAESVVNTNTAVVPIQLNLPGLIEDILQVLPKTTNLVVALGTSPLERYWMAQAQRDFAPFTNRLAINFLNALPLEAMCKQASALPPNSAVLYGSLVRDAAGIPYEQEAGLDALYAVANAPLFGVYEHQMSRGIVGGRLISNQVWGRRTAEAALRILSGEPADSIKSEPTVPAAPVYDWRELQRWGIKDALLPPGRTVRYRAPTTWEHHKWEIMGSAALCALEAALIVALVVQLRRRRKAELDRQRSRDELAHVARVSTMGELTSTLAHELSQPLGAILRNAEAAELFLQKTPPDYEELRAIVADIRGDDLRAAAVIDRMHSLLKRRESHFESLSLAELLVQVEKLVRSELTARRVILEVDVSSDLPAVRGDRVQLQQVLLNLLINGVDALNGRPPERRRLSVRAARMENQAVEVTVRDTGPGIPVDELAKIFEPFFTTKAGGLGLGLAISQTIVQAHGGRIQAENAPDGGAIFRFTLKEAKP